MEKDSKRKDGKLKYCIQRLSELGGCVADITGDSPFPVRNKSYKLWDVDHRRCSVALVGFYNVIQG